ncbi:hypothetical protein [Piscinibacter terrae]|uniref:hypothetical protein n=1 Tax=Piscinibacter terrae TaxID=2496871 RepID=UPI000F596B2A|nr:hypothetical protein [Albitalea terrae]
MSGGPTALPPVGKDGRLDDAFVQGRGAGAILSQVHGGTSVLGGLRSGELLAACTPLPARLLLSHAIQTLQDRKKSAMAQAWLYALLGVFPVLFALGFLVQYMGASRGFAGTCFVAVMIGLMMKGYWKVIRDPEKAWERVHWLDFEARTWEARRSFLDGRLPEQRATVPMDELVLLCFVQQWEHSDSYDVGLCKLSELKASERDVPGCLNIIHSADQESEAHDFARALAALWGIDCWEFAGGIPPSKRKLA